MDYKLKAITSVPYGKLIIIDPYYRLNGLEEFYFDLSDKKNVIKYINDFLIDNMLNYSCDGCRYCCYGCELYRERCEKRFFHKSELPEYFKLILKSDTDIILKEIFIVPSDIGFNFEEKSIWSLSENKEE